MADQQQLGSFEWYRRTDGALSFGDRMRLLATSLPPSTVALTKGMLRIGPKAALSLEELDFPDSRSVTLALEELRDCAPQEVVQHSLRTWAFAAAFGKVHGLAYEREMLTVGCLLHDVGMTERHRDHGCTCFAADSAKAAKALMEREDWSAELLDELAYIICLHMNGHSTPADGHEAFLLQQGTACDVAGVNAYTFSEAFWQEVAGRYPRGDVDAFMTAFFAGEKKRHPRSRAALLVQVGLPMMIRLSPFRGT